MNAFHHVREHFVYSYVYTVAIACIADAAYVYSYTGSDYVRL